MKKNKGIGHILLIIVGLLIILTMVGFFNVRRSYAPGDIDPKHKGDWHLF